MCVQKCTAITDRKFYGFIIEIVSFVIDNGSGMTVVVNYNVSIQNCGRVSCIYDFWNLYIIRIYERWYFIILKK